MPWHLATVEFAREIRRVLRPGGVYALNVIDQPPLKLARAEAATLRAAFGDVALVAPGGAPDSDEAGGGPLIAARATDAPPRGGRQLRPARVGDRAPAGGLHLAPADQLISR